MFLRQTLLLAMMASMAAGFSLRMSSSDPPAPSGKVTLIPDQGARTTMNPFYQIPKFSAYPKRVEDRRAGRGLPSYQGISLPSYTGMSSYSAEANAAAPEASSSSLANKPSEEEKGRFSAVPDQGRGATMNPRYQINKYSTYPPHMNR